MSATIDSPMLWRKANGGDRMAQLTTSATTGLFRSVSSQNGLQTTASKLTSGRETAPVSAIDDWSEFWPSDRRQGSPAAATGCRVELTTGSGLVNVNGQTMTEQIDGGGGSSSRRRIASQFNKICMRFNSSALPSCLRPSAASGKMLSNSIEGLCTVGTEIRIEVPLRCAVEKSSTTSAPRLQSPPIVVEKQRSAPEEACCTVDSASSSAGVPEVAAGVPDVASVDVSGVPAALVATILDDDMSMSGLTPEAGGDQLLVLDCRTFVAYNAMHVRDALNVSCSDCISRKRLLTGRTTIGDLVSGGVDGDAKDRYRRVVDAAREVGGVKGGPAQAIVYDEDTSDFRELPPNSPVRLVVSCLLKDGFAVYYMIGGLKAFRKDYGHLCSHSGLPLTRPSVSSAGGCPSPSSDGHVDNAKISMILPHLFIGNEHDAADRALLDQLGIRHVINVTSHVPLHFESNGIRYIRFPAADNGVQNLRQYFEDAIRFIDDVQKRGERAMVHCQAGVSRSSTIAIAYVMARSNLNMLDAFRFVKSRRPIVAPNFNFMGQLLDFENSLARAKPPEVARVPLPAIVGFIAECQNGRRMSREESCCLTATVE